MNYRKTTQVPNVIFDRFVPILKPSEVIVLLVIIRQTFGWHDQKTGKRKQRDWISSTQFKKKTGLSNKTISRAIATLIELNIVRATDRFHNVLITPKERKGHQCIFYQCLIESGSTYVKSSNVPVYKVHTTKLTSTKLKGNNGVKKQIRKLTDSERIEEILKEKRNT